MDYSVLMSVYYKEKPDNLKASIDSIINQSLPTNDFIIVCDGELTPELDAILEFYQKKYSYISIVKLSVNMGLGKALNYGLEYCKNELIARMDSDDISFYNRCESQISEFINNEDISILSASVLEFSDNNLERTIEKLLPVNHTEIVHFSKRRNPFNHPVVMFKKNDIKEVGGYIDFPLYEDYYLWIRLILSGKKTANISKPLLYMRTSQDLYKRRGGIKYFRTGVKFQKYLLKTKHITYLRFIINLSTRFIVQVLFPNSIRSLCFRQILRKKRSTI